MRYVAVVVAVLLALPAAAERGQFGEVFLNGLARDQPLIGREAVMVCNVSAVDGFLSIRAGPGTQHGIVRKLKRLAVVEINASERRGRWVRVLSADRNVTPDGRGQAFKSLPVQGWAHDGYLCDFIH